MICLWLIIIYYMYIISVLNIYMNSNVIFMIEVYVGMYRKVGWGIFIYVKFIVIMYVLFFFMDSFVFYI